MMERYNEWRGNMHTYPHTVERMCSAYIDLFEKFAVRRKAITEQRRLFRSPYLFLRNQIAI